MEKLSDLAIKIAKSHDLKQEMDAAFILKKFEKIIEINWGNKGKINLKPQKILFNRVYVKVSNSAWAQELQLQKHNIIIQLNQENIKKVLEIKILL
jgi:hypothetical protein